MDTSLLRGLEKYMFSSKNLNNYNKCLIELERAAVSLAAEPILDEPVASKPILAKPIAVEPILAKPIAVEPILAKPILAKAILAEPILAEPIAVEPILAKPILAENTIVKVEKKTPIKKSAPLKKPDEEFIPFQKDKLFWCFYTLLKGFSEYEMHRTGHFAVEKAFKISTVEKLRAMKQEIKELKLKISEVEDELVNKVQITLKGLQVLCLVYKVSITYIYGKKYCEFLYNETNAVVKGIIKQTEGKEHALIYEDAIDLPNIKQTHWFIENVQKPLKAPSAYTLKELQDICDKLEIPLKHDIGKSKTKKDLYEDILVNI